MNTTTINISLPTALYADLKKAVSKHRYTSVSELIREAVRNWLYPRTTVNGFTPAFENKVLASAKEPRKNDIVLTSDKEIRDYFTKLVRPHKSRKKALMIIQPTGKYNQMYRTLVRKQPEITLVVLEKVRLFLLPMMLGSFMNGSEKIPLGFWLSAVTSGFTPLLFSQLLLRVHEKTFSM